jgi:hypothetical protein
MYRTIVVLSYQNAGVEGSLASTPLAKRTNSLGTVALGPVEAIPLSSTRLAGTWWRRVLAAVTFHRAHAHSILDVSEPTRCRTRICLIRFPQPSHLCLRLCIAVYSPAKANLIPEHADSQRTYAPRTPHVVPIPIHEVLYNELERHKRRKPSPYFRRGLSALDARHSFATITLSWRPLKPSFLLSPSRRRFASV